jgi:hypothetical protein
MSTPTTVTVRPISPAGCRVTPPQRVNSLIRGLQAAWVSLKKEPYDFFVQGATWKLGAISIAILRKQFDKTYVAVAFENNGRAVSLNFIVVNGPDGWVIADVESPHDSLRMFLAQYRN